MEWTGEQQIQCLLQSICLGLMQGATFDVFTGLGRQTTRFRRWVLDAFFGPIAGLMLFFGTLVIMDGQLHPLLLVGSLIGLLLEHITIGAWLAASVDLIHLWCLKVIRFLKKMWVRMVVLTKLGAKKLIKCEKNRKIAD